MVARRNLLVAGAIGDASGVLPKGTGWACTVAHDLVGALDPATIQKYVTPLVIPARMPPIGKGGRFDRYAIGVRQSSQQALPPPPVYIGHAVASAAGVF